MLRKIVSAVVALGMVSPHVGAMTVLPEVLEVENKARFLPVVQSMKGLYKEGDEQWLTSNDLLTEPAARQLAVSVVFSMCDPEYVGRKGMIPFLMAYADYYSESKSPMDIASGESFFPRALRRCATCVDIYQSKEIKASHHEVKTRFAEQPANPCAKTLEELL